jgi:hypothetical protein
MLGMIVPLICPRGIGAANSSLLNRYFLATVLVEIFLFIPLGGYLISFYPAWSLAYFSNPADWPLEKQQLLAGSVLGGYLLCNIGGFALAARLVRSGRAQTGWIALAGVAAALAIFSLITLKQLTLVGAFADWTAVPRTAVPIWTHRIGWIIGLDGLLMGVVLLLTLREFRRQE